MICNICGQIITVHELRADCVKVRPRNDKTKYYHETCIECERNARGYTNNLTPKED